MFDPNLSDHEEKELMQELGMVKLTDELYGIKRKVGEIELIIPATASPQRIVTEDYEESQEIYKERRKLMKYSQKQQKRGQQFWDPQVMGTYKKKKAEEVQAQYEELLKEEDLDKAGQKLEKIAKKNFKK